MLERFKEVFAGLQTAYGQTKVTDELSENGKHEAKSFTKKEPVTDLLWQKHLNGDEPALGIVPIKEDNKCKWGCIDIDTYPFDHKVFIKKIRDKNLPLILFRSKSGGAHVFLFTKEFVAASLMRERLKKIAGILGYAKTEIFPKQDYIRADRGDTGSFLNVPYHGSNKTVRYAFDDNGEPLKIEDFFRMYDKYSLTEKELFTLKISENNDSDDLLKGAPPCLQAILKDGMDQGGRNTMMYNVGVYLKKRFPNEWQTKMHLYDQQYMKPPLGHKEIGDLIDSVSKKDYKYQCKLSPLIDFCDAKTCSKREFGVGDDVPAPEITGLSKYLSDPPIYFLTVDGKTVELDDITLHEYDKLSIACMNQISMPLLPVGKIVWRKQLNKLFSKLEELEAPESLRIDVQIKDLLHDYIHKSNGKTLDDVAKGVPYIGEDKTYIKYHFFWKHLQRSKSWTRNREKTFTLLKTLFEAEEKTIKINKKSNRVVIFPNSKLDKPNKPDIRVNKMKDPAFK
jgi:hypothetical protein